MKTNIKHSQQQSPPHPYEGTLIAIEGIDGSGKSTLTQSLSALIAQWGHRVMSTKEPGKTRLGMQLREILQTQTVPIDPKAEFLLFAADRAQHFAEIVIPALQEGAVVISDRMADSSLAYQGYARGVSHDAIKYINAWAMNNIVPDIVLYISIDAETAEKRLKKRAEKLTAFEQMHSDTVQKIIRGFEDIYTSSTYPDTTHIIRLDGTVSASALVENASQQLKMWLENKNSALKEKSV